MLTGDWRCLSRDEWCSEISVLALSENLPTVIALSEGPSVASAATTPDGVSDPKGVSAAQLRTHNRQR
jgi:hypothetical protein